MVISSSDHESVDKFVSLISAYESLHPEFIAELDTLNITVGEYETMLADSEPRVITTNNSTS